MTYDKSISQDGLRFPTLETPELWNMESSCELNCKITTESLPHLPSLKSRCFFKREEVLEGNRAYIDSQFAY